MSLLDKASLIVTPNAVKAGKLFSVIPSSGLGDLNAVRNTTATRVNELGLIENVAANVPRIDYADGECPSILIEPQRTNLLINSTTLSNWTQTRSTITNNTIISPEGINNGSSLIEGSTNNTQISFVNSNYSSYSTVSFSVFMKKGTRNYGVLATDQTITTACIFDLNLGTITYQGTNFINSKIESFSNGWYKCSVTALGSNYGNLIRISPSNSGTNMSYQGDGVSGIYIFGSQSEEGSYPTSYIPTQGSAVTRNADVISKTGISDLIGQEDGCFQINFKYFQNDTLTSAISISNGTSQNRMFLFKQNDNLTVTVVANNVVFSGLSTNLTGLIGSFNTVAIRYSLSLISLWINGLKVSEISKNQPFVFNRIGFDSGAGFSSFSGNFKSLVLFKTALNDSEMIALTTL
jgi:hypothetical protein